MSTQRDLTVDAHLRPASLTAIVEKVLAQARREGADAAEVAASMGQGLSVTVRLGDVETVEHNRDKHVGLTVFFGQRSGSASTSDFSDTAIRDTVRSACSIAKYTAADDCAGLADADRLAKEIPDLDLYHPWNPDTAQAIALARACEDAARGVDARIKNSEGATLSSHAGVEVYGGRDRVLEHERLSGAKAGAEQRRGFDGRQRIDRRPVCRDRHEPFAPLVLSRQEQRNALQHEGLDRKSTRLNSSHMSESRMPSSA